MTINNFINRIIHMAPERNLTLIGHFMGRINKGVVELFALHVLILISQMFTSDASESTQKRYILFVL